MRKEPTSRNQHGNKRTHEDDLRPSAALVADCGQDLGTLSLLVLVGIATGPLRAEKQREKKKADGGELAHERAKGSHQTQRAPTR